LPGHGGSPPALASSKQAPEGQGKEPDVARRDIKGVVDFAYLEDFAAGDDALIDEVLALFREQSEIWGGMLDPASEGWRDAVHTLKGASRGVGAFRLGDACEACEAAGAGALGSVRDALDAALSDIAAYAHERALASLKSPRRPA
jgi:HPt (histidine-containing phosphotransfer) domain-containing protein